ncbi:hypothetical protein OGAPHI_004937 [Ogataea philodendri]|uniref:Geranylgeranyl transferase type-2 subunit alpha n=1 Tax=Ogataea philodendri TaxID=1378263 RepID=A0A9P8P1Z8_9ASCO|nr:uncharacterized protein OGAPHI_004937 [Ogataea philodendri]KAH3663536.1 hypothetical protein OGAPHI_004937 [Ogataea philodendri]
MKIHKDAPKITRYRAFVDKVLRHKQAQLYTESAFAETAKLLDVNPELYTIWNYRRDILLDWFKPDTPEATHELIKQELVFTVGHLKRFPKCYWIWNHRKWCLEYDSLTNWDNEMVLIDKFLEADSRNYHVWQYRRYVIDRMKLAQSPKQQAQTDLQEFEYTTKQISKDISNYSALHNRSRLIKLLFERSPECATLFYTKNKHGFLVEEWKLAQNAFYTDPDDSSVWIYIKWLLGDYFLNDLTKDQAREVVENAIQDISKLNALEAEESSHDNQWCLKTLVFLEQQLSRVTGVRSEKKNQLLEKLVQQDTIRAKRYQDAKD